MQHRPVRAWVTAALAAAFVWLFFLEYLPPFDRVHIPYDLSAWFYPLADYAYQALRDGRFPQWDAGIYCGIPFAGNIAASLFYPPTWLAFAANAGRPLLAFHWVEALVIAHVWLAFLLCYLWLRGKNLATVASAIGAGAYAFGGYLCQHWQHYNVVAGYAWMPLAFWGIDQAAEKRRWRPLWKVAAASALCLLAGYPPLWLVFVVSMAAYTAWRWRLLLRVALAVAASIALSAVQLLPAWRAAAMRTPEVSYGAGLRDLWHYMPFLLPNYPDLAIGAQGSGGDQYLYLGAAAWLGLLLLPWARDRRSLPPLAVAGVALVFCSNPYDMVWGVIRHWPILTELCRSWYFLAALPLAAAPLAALGIHHALARKRAPGRWWAAAIPALLLLAWAARQVLLWLRGDLAAGWMTLADVGIMMALCALALRMLPGQKGLPGAVLAAALLVAAGAEYKVFGTSNRLNAAVGQPHWTGSFEHIPAMDPTTFSHLRRNSQYRVLVDLTASWPQELRHYRFATPQGFDTLLPDQYRKLVGQGMGRFRNNREFDVEPENEAALRLFGVRFYISSINGPHYRRLVESPHFRLVEPSSEYHKAFEYVNAQPPFGWESPGAAHLVRALAGTPERRRFEVRSETGGRFFLAEQFYPGWRAAVDGRPVPIERWRGAFQSIQVPAGEHHLEFRYRTPGLLPGAALSLVSALLFAGLLLRRW